MLIGGLQKLTLIDYPGKIACTVFTVGCNFRCPFCHNPELIDRAKFNLSGIITEEDFFKFLESRKGLLDGVCVTGGEPTLHQDLPQFLKKIKDLGFFVKLDTNGTTPEVISSLINNRLLDYIAMDVKNSLSETNLYEKTVGTAFNLENIKKSVKLIMGSGIDYEFRTTVVPGLHTEENILSLAAEIRGAKKYYLQQFRPGEKIFKEEYIRLKPYPADFSKNIREKIEDFFEICEIRE